MLLKDKVVIITGVGPGMGQALARIAAAEGAKVVMAARRQGYLDEVAADIKAKGGEVLGVACDVTNKADCDALVAAATAAFGPRIHGVVNSAYLHGPWTFVENLSAEDINQTLDVNCVGALNMVQAALPALKGGASVVNVATMATVKPYGTEHGMELAYAVSKSALHTLGKYMAVDLGKYSIRVNTCRLGWIGGQPVEDFIQSQVDQGHKREDVIGNVTKDIPLGIIPPEDDCARGVLMLLSDYAAVVTGAALDINGGHWIPT